MCTLKLSNNHLVILLLEKKNLSFSFFSLFSHLPSLMMTSICEGLASLDVLEIQRAVLFVTLVLVINSSMHRVMILPSSLHTQLGDNGTHGLNLEVTNLSFSGYLWWVNAWVDSLCCFVDLQTLKCIPLKTFFMYWLQVGLHLGWLTHGSSCFFPSTLDIFHWLP